MEWAMGNEGLQFQGNGKGLAASYLEAVVAAGFDPTNKRDMDMGIVAYNSALLVWHSYKKGLAVGARAASSKNVGRNERCPCGSGLKFKKCCLMAQRAPAAAVQGLIPFSSDLIPRLADSMAMDDELRGLTDIMNFDKELRAIRFKGSDITEFLQKVIPGGVPPDNAEFDHLTFRFALESGKHRILSNIKDKFLAAAPSATTAAQLRGLASGAFFGMAYDMDQNHDNPLISIIFRLSLFDAIGPIESEKNRAGAISPNLEGIFDLLDGNWNSDFKQRFDVALAKLSKDDQKVLYSLAVTADPVALDRIWNGDFPVGLPYPTMLLFYFTINSLPEKKIKSDAGAVMNRVRKATSLLLPDDTAFYLTLLDQWLVEHSDGNDQDRVSDVRAVAAMVKCGFLAELVPRLWMQVSQSGQMMCLNEEELAFVQHSNPGDSLFLDKYADWLYQQGFPDMAKRTRGFKSFRQKAVQTAANLKEIGKSKIRNLRGIASESLDCQ
jgi:hypothetical protein